MVGSTVNLFPHVVKLGMHELHERGMPKKVTGGLPGRVVRGGCDAGGVCRRHVEAESPIEANTGRGGGATWPLSFCTTHRLEQARL